MSRKLDVREDDADSDESCRVTREKAMVELESSSAPVVFDARAETDGRTPAGVEMRRSA